MNTLTVKFYGTDKVFLHSLQDENQIIFMDNKPIREENGSKTIHILSIILPDTYLKSHVRDGLNFKSRQGNYSIKIPGNYIKKYLSVVKVVLNK